MSEQLPQQNEIARLNDAFRKAGPTEDWYITLGIQLFPDVPALVQAVQTYTDFNDEVDPAGEHDMGRLHWREEKVYWKIDYFDQSLRYWADPLSDECRRVMTLLLSSEY